MNCPFIKTECEKEECIFWCIESLSCKLVTNCQHLIDIKQKLDTIIQNQLEGNP